VRIVSVGARAAWAIGAGLALAACTRGDSRSTAPTTLAPEGKWLDSVPSFPDAREVGVQHVSGSGATGALHIICHLYATTKPPDQVVAFYATRIPGATGSQDRARLDARVGKIDVSVRSALGRDAPRCGATLAPGDRTVIVLSQLIR